MIYLGDGRPTDALCFTVIRTNGDRRSRSTIPITPERVGFKKCYHLSAHINPAGRLRRGNRLRRKRKPGILPDSAAGLPARRLIQRGSEGAGEMAARRVRRDV